MDSVLQTKRSEFKCDVYKKSLQYFLNYTYFKESKTRVWELIFSPQKDGEALTEYEIIQLSKYFVGKQEKSFPTLYFKNWKPEDENQAEMKPHEQFIIEKRDYFFDFLSKEFYRHYTSIIIKNNNQLRVKSGNGSNRYWQLRIH